MSRVNPAPDIVKDPRSTAAGDATKILYLYANVIYMTLNVSWLVTHDSVPLFQYVSVSRKRLYSEATKVVFSLRQVSCVSMRL